MYPTLLQVTLSDAKGYQRQVHINKHDIAYHHENKEKSKAG